MTAYEERVRQELATYNEVEEVHDLPPIYHWWSRRYLQPLLEDVGLDSLQRWWDDEVFALCSLRAPATARLVGLGAGNGDLEIDMAARLAERGIENLELVLLELNPVMLERAAAHAERAGIVDRVLLRDADLNTWEALEPADVYVACHSLHHVVELEHLFEQVSRSLAADGLILVNDMVGRNGHRRWPEAMAIVEALWAELEPRQRHNNYVGGEDVTYPDVDCSGEGFEGVRAEDILPLLLERFHPEIFVTFTNLVGPFVDRVYGPNFDPDDRADRELVDAIAKLDELAIDLGVVRPTQLLATFRASPVPCRYPRRRSPARVVRDPAAPPFDRPSRSDPEPEQPPPAAPVAPEGSSRQEQGDAPGRAVTEARARYDALRGRKVVRVGLALTDVPGLRARLGRGNAKTPSSSAAAPASSPAPAAPPPLADPPPAGAAEDIAALLSLPWMYEFDLGDGLKTAVPSAELLDVHATRAALAEPVARQALARAGGAARAIDLACSEGWFSHRLLDWGAHTVTGVDIRDENIRRATLVRDRLGIDPARLALRRADVFELDPAELGIFDVVLCFGLVYHLENPIGALRVARRLTRGVCIVESQLTEQVEPIRHGWGTTGEFLEQEASWATYFEPPQLQESHLVASYGGVVSLIPNRAALLEAMTAAGFHRVQALVAETGNAQYVGGHRLVVAGWP